MLTLWLLFACTPAPKDTGAPPAETGESGETADSSPDSAESGEGEGEGEGDTAVDYCDGVPTVTYESFGRGFLTGNCQGCHASTAANRYDAPEDVTFDTVEEVWAQAWDILDEATTYDGDEPTMPPQGGVTEDDQTLVQWWLLCADPGT